MMRRAARVTTTCAKPWRSISPASRTTPAARAASTIRLTWIVPVSPSAGARKAGIAAVSGPSPPIRSPKLMMSRPRFNSGRRCSLRASGAAAAGSAVKAATVTGVPPDCGGAASAAPQTSSAARQSEGRIMMRYPV